MRVSIIYQKPSGAITNKTVEGSQMQIHVEIEKIEDTKDVILICVVDLLDGRVLI